jgi:hypothetical protein
MPRFVIPNSASLHTARSFISRNSPFRRTGSEAVLELHPKWIHVEPVALTMVAAWGAWCRREGYSVRVENLGAQAAYLARMKLLDHLGVTYDPGIEEHEEAGRFLPIRRVLSAGDVRSVIGDISALLHLQEDPESLSAVQYCVSELIRNVLEHSRSPDGAFVAAHRYTKKEPHRVTLAVADCGAGIAGHLAQAFPELDDDTEALGLAMQPGVTGAVAGPYGTPDNAGAGLYITRCISKGTGGYFFLMSGDAGYRLRRARNDDEMTALFADPYAEPRHDLWNFRSGWPGTVVSVEIRTEKIGDYDGFFQWIFRQIPRKDSKRRRIRFT